MSVLRCRKMNNYNKFILDLPNVDRICVYYIIFAILLQYILVLKFIIIQLVY